MRSGILGFKVRIYVLVTRKGTAEKHEGVWVVWGGRCHRPSMARALLGSNRGGFDHPWVLLVPVPWAQGWLEGDWGLPAASVPCRGPLHRGILHQLFGAIPRTLRCSWACRAAVTQGPRWDAARAGQGCSEVGYSGPKGWMVQGCMVTQSRARLNKAEDSPPDTTPVKFYQQIYGEVSPLLWVFFVFLIANQNQPRSQSRVQVGLSGELASFPSVFAGLKIYMLKLGFWLAIFFLILGL